MLINSLIFLIIFKNPFYLLVPILVIYVGHDKKKKNAVKHCGFT